MKTKKRPTPVADTLLQVATERMIFRLSAKEKSAIQALAAAEHRTESNFIRCVLIAYLSTASPPK